MLSLGVVVPRFLGMGNTLLTAPTSVVGLPGAVPRRRLGPGARHVAGEPGCARAEARATLLAREAEGAQLLALRSHLDPHFLFNTLNAIAEWCREDGETAERAVMRLSAMLRTVLAGVRASTWPLAEELALLDTLFELHRCAIPTACASTRRLPDPLPDVAVPPMLLLPLAENAVKHGPAAGHAGEIVLTAHATDRRSWSCRSQNPGAYRGRRPGGSGIEIVERRLALAYDGQAVLTIAAVGDTTRAEVTLPIAAAPAWDRPHEQRRRPSEPLRVLVADDEAIARKRLVRLLAAMPDVVLAGECADAHEVLERVRAGGIDVVLLDIQMPELSGIEALQLFPADGPVVIFCTAHTAHAVAAFDVGAIDYLLKPIERRPPAQGAGARARSRRAPALPPTSWRASRAAATGDKPLDRLALPTRQGIVLLDPLTVSHAELDGELVTVHTLDAQYLSALSLQELESRLPGDRFARVHRRALVNLEHVVRLEPNEVGGYTARTRGGHAVEVSRQAARDLRKRLGLR